MRIDKNTLIYLICALIFFLSNVLAQSTEDQFYYQWFDESDPTIVSRDIVYSQVVEPNDGILKKTLRVFWLDQYISLSNASALEYVKTVLNIALSLTALVAFIIIIYGFAQILFAQDDEAITNARKTVQWAAIAIAIIAVSWFLVTFLFSIYESVRSI